MTGSPIIDARVQDYGSIALIMPTSNAGEDWLHEHLAGDPPRFGRSYAIEWRYLDDIVAGMLEDGLEVR